MLSELLIIQGIVERGLIFAICVIALYLTSRVIKFDDLSLEGSFGLGGAVMALLLSKNIVWWLAWPVAGLAGACAGLATGLLHTKLKLNNLISGIVVTTALFSVNLKCAGATMMIGNLPSFFGLFSSHSTNTKYMLLIPLTLCILMTIRWFLTTEYGFLLRVVGDNPQMLINLGKNPHHYIIAALMISNMLTALCGALFVQYVGYFSIWASVGILIITLAGLILAETINHRLGYAMIIGAIAYQAIIALTFELNVDPEWNKLITALLIIGMIALKRQSLLAQRN